MSLPGGQILYHGVYDHGVGWWWSTDRPVISEPGGRHLALSIEVDNEGDHPTADQLALVQEVLGHLPDLMAKFKKRLPQECLEFDSGDWHHLGWHVYIFFWIFCFWSSKSRGGSGS